MTGREQTRSELAKFLRAKRQQADPALAGRHGVGRRRTPGLRREEVSFLSGVSLTWYTWLEQGRDIAPSAQVLDAVARTLELTEAEHRYVLSLAGHPLRTGADEVPTVLPDHVARLLAALSDSPAFVITPTWSIVGWNDAYEALYPTVATLARTDRNLLWLVFTDAALHELLANWDVDSGRFLAQFRSENGARLHLPDVSGLIARLEAASPDFAAAWGDLTVEAFASRERTFAHPVVGELILESHRLSLSDSPRLGLVVYTAAPGTDTHGKLVRLRRGRDEDGDLGK